MNDTIDQMVRDRDAALLSLDEATIRAYGTKYGATMADDPNVFWPSVHKAITACLNLPREFRLASKAWLLERGMRSMDDGDLT